MFDGFYPFLWTGTDRRRLVTYPVPRLHRCNNVLKQMSMRCYGSVCWGLNAHSGHRGPGFLVVWMDTWNFFLMCLCLWIETGPARGSMTDGKCTMARRQVPKANDVVGRIKGTERRVGNDMVGSPRVSSFI